MKATVERYNLDNCDAFKFYLPHFYCECANNALEVRENFETLEIFEENFFDYFKA